MRKYKNARIVSFLAVLILSTACSTTDETTITAAPGDTPTGDSTPAPTDGTAAPDDTPTPGDDTAVPTDSTAAPGGGIGTPDDTPTGDSMAAPDGTPTPGDDTTAPTDSTTTTDTSETSVTASDQDSADGQESAETAPFTYEYPESWLINPNDPSTSLGKLCWALFEYTSSVFARINQVLADNTPNWEVTFPAVADITEGADNGVGPVGVVNEESNEQSIGSEGYLIGSLNKILERSRA